MAHGGMAGRSAANPKPMPRRPWTLGRQWRVDEGMRLCRERFTPAATGADLVANLVGVARSNQTSSTRGEELCLTILRTGNV